MLDHLLNFFKSPTPQPTSHIKTALKYEAKTENIKTTAIKE